MTFFRLHDTALEALLVGVVLWAVVGAVSAQDKKPLPDAAAQKRALGLLHDVYGKEYDAAKTSKEKTKLAKKLLDQAAKSKADPASHFVLLRVAKDVSVLAADAETALDAVERIVATYDVDAMEMRLDCVKGLAAAAKFSSQHGALAEQAYSLVDVALAEDDFEAAGQFAKIAQDSAKRGRSYSLLKEIVARMKALDELQQAHAEYQKAMARLEESPTDPEANLAAGRYLCLSRGEWERGIPMLALSSDPALKGPAVKELTGADSPDAQIALGDAWWDLAQTMEGRERNCFLLRGGHWYEKAQAKVTAGLAKEKLDQRLEEIAKIEPLSTKDADRARPGSSARRGRPFDPTNVTVLGTLQGHTGSVHALAFGSDEFLMASGGDDKAVIFWDVRSGETRGILRDHGGGVLCVAFGRDGSLFASGGLDHTVKLGVRMPRATLLGHTHQVRTLAFSPDGSILASASEDGSLKLWDLARGEVVHTVPSEHLVTSLAFSPDGSLVATGSRNRQAVLWDVATGELRKTFPGHHRGHVRGVLFSPDGSTLASCSNDGTIRLWDVATGNLRQTLEGHTGEVRSIALTRDGATLASAGWQDGTVKLWDMASGQLRATLTGHTGGVYRVAFSPDGSLLASAGGDGRIKLWGTDPDRRGKQTEPARRAPAGRVATRRIDFRRPDAIRQFVLSKPENVAWNAEEKAMVIRSDKRGMAMATYAEHFRSISSVTVRSKIVPPSQHCLRIGVGPLSLLLNWSGGNENRFHAWQDVTATRPHALAPGTMHEIQIAQVDERVVISVDGNEHHTMAARLDGTVTVYTAYGNTIAVSEILIEGVPEPGVRVTKPSHGLR